MDFFYEYFSFSFNMGAKNFKKLFLMQLASENVQTLPDFFSQWSSQHYAWNFWKFLKNEILKIFFSLEPNGIENFNTLFLLQIAAKSFQTWPDFSSQWSSQNRKGDFWNFEFPIFNDYFFFPRLSGKWAIVERNVVKFGTAKFDRSLENLSRDIALTDRRPEQKIQDLHGSFGIKERDRETEVIRENAHTHPTPWGWNWAHFRSTICLWAAVSEILADFLIFRIWAWNLELEERSQSCIYALFLPHWVEIKLIFALRAAVFEIRAIFQNFPIWAWNLEFEERSQSCICTLFVP